MPLKSLSIIKSDLGPREKLKEGNYSLPSETLVKSQQKLSEKLKNGPASYSKVFPGIILANGEAAKDVSLLRRLQVSHILNAAEGHVSVRSTELAMNGIHYRGFHVDDLPSENIYQHLQSSANYIHEVVSHGGVILVNCYMGLSRSASCVLAYLIAHQNMSLDKALTVVRTSRPVNPNEGFILQLRKFHSNFAHKKETTRKFENSSRSLF